MIQNDPHKKSQVVIVTGGSQNIGWAIVSAFAKKNAQVIIADMNAPEEKLPDHCHFFQTNITQENDVKKLFQFIQEKFQSVDVLINNAGIAIEKTFSDMTVDEWDKVMSINVKGVFLCSKYAIQQIQSNKAIENRKGVIVNIGSIEGLGANPTHSVYAASKGAVHSLTRNIAIDHGKDGIRCNAIAPGWINTPFNEAFVENFPHPQQAMQEIKALHPLGKLGTPQDIAELALWLSCDQSQFVNGQIITLDGARTAKLPLPSF